MDDDQLDADFEIVRRLKHLSGRYKKGVQELRPMSEKLRDTIQKEILKDWEQEQKAKQLHDGKRQESEKEKAEKQREEKERRDREAKKGNSNDQGSEQGHSH